MRDIAERVGVSVNSVSKALSNKPDISPLTKESILRVAAEIGYDLTNQGRRNVGHLTGIIGLVTSDNANPFFAQIVKGAEWTAQQFGYTMMIFNTDEKYSRERKAIDILIDRKVDGIILTPSQSQSEDLNFLMSNDKPFVLLGRHFSQYEIPSVVSDDEQGAYLAVDHLVRLGHRRILFLNAPEYISSAQERLAGYTRALENAGIEVQPDLVRSCHPTKLGAHNEIQAVLLEEIEFSAVFTFSDLMMLGVVELFQERSIRIPEEYSLVGFDDIDFVSLLTPPLTTVSQDKFNLGAQSAELLLSLIHNERVQVGERVLPTRLIVRGSTRKAR